MPRRRIDSGGELAFHVLNRAAWKQTIFADEQLRLAFVRLLAEAKRRFPLRLLTFCVMPTHFHLVAWPHDDHQLPEFMHWLTGTHAQRWRVQNGTTGTGAVYQGRYKAIPVQTGAHLLRLCRYVERNPLRATLVRRAELWRCGGLGQRELTVPDVELDPWPVERPADWIELVNHAENPRELSTLRRCIALTRPYGESSWSEGASARLGLATQGRGRPVRTAAPAPSSEARRLFEHRMPGGE